MSVEVSTNKIQQQTRVVSPSTESDSSQSKAGPKSTIHHHHHNSHMYKRSASTSNLPLNNPSTASLTKKPQYSGRLKAHNRSLSHNKLFSTSTGTGGQVRPHLNRSKSSDVLVKNRQTLKRNSRSFTKMSGLQPLTKTTSNPSIRSNKSTSSLKGIAMASAVAAATAASGAGGVVPGQIGLKSSSKRERAILRLNDNDADYEDVEDTDRSDTATPPIPERFNSDDTIPNLPHDNSEQNIPSLFEQINRMVPPSAVPTPTVEKENVIENQEYKPSEVEEQEQRQYSSNSDKLEVVVEGSTIDSTRPNIGGGSSNQSSNQSSNEDFSPQANLYGGSLLLSQSTGLIRKIDPMSTNIINQKNSFRDQSLPFNNSISGISFKANPMTNLAEPVITNQNVIQNNSYQPNQTIFNNLQRTNNQYLTTKKQSQSQLQQQQQHQQPQQQNEEIINSIHNGANNFTDFLRASSSSTDSHQGGTGHHNNETRTQQKLWLQRESSLMDVTSNVDGIRLPNFSNLSLNNLMFAHNYSNQSHLNIRDLQQNQNQQQQQQQQQHIQPLTPLTPVTSSTNGGGSGSATSEGTVNIGNINGILMQVQGTHQSSIQSRTEFERLNREYLNVRRHLNPVGESLNRLDKYIKGELKITKNNIKGQSQEITNVNSFKEYCPSFQEKEAEVASTLGKLWKDAIFTSLGSHGTTPPSRPSIQRPGNARIASYNQNQHQSQPVQTGTRSAPPQQARKLTGS